MRSAWMILFLAATLFSCVPQKQYTDLQESLEYYKRQSLASDSVEISNRMLAEENRQTEADLKETMHELEQLTATNISLNKSYQEILQKYNAIVNQNREVLATSSYETLSLQEELARQQSQLDERNRALELAERDLYQKETKLSVMEYSMTEKGATQDAEASWRCEKMSQVITRHKQQLGDLHSQLSEALAGFSNNDVSVVAASGKLYVTFSQPFLFGVTADQITWNGSEALREVAGVFKKFNNLYLTVEGHTTTDGTAARNWDVSVLKATTVVKLLSELGVTPEQLTASGRGYFAPVVSNGSQQGKVQNMRTVLIFSPNVDELLIWSR
ncbi:MAG: OmpA family protein [Saprospiraceae bacterium]|nr:OmpA family protein [Saprospiraceae bacterium]